MSSINKEEIQQGEIMDCTTATENDEHRDVIGSTTMHDKIFTSVDEVLNYIGGYGRFQKTLNVIFCIVFIPMFSHPFMMYFLTLEPSWRCAHNSSVCTRNATFASDNMERCFMSRSDWVFTEPHEYSLVTTFDIYCGGKWIIYLANSVIFISWSIGAVVCGWIADRHGRKIVTIPSVLMTIVLGVCLVFSQSPFMFITVRFLIGFFVPGGTHQLYVYLSEFVTAKERSLSLSILTCFVPISEVMLGLIAYFVRDWRRFLMLCSAPYIIIVILLFFLPESVGWLHANQKNDDLIKIFKRIAYWNKREVPNDFQLIYPTSDATTAEQESNYLHSFRLGKIGILGFAWATMVMTFYGLALAANDLGQSIYLNFILLALSEFPAYFLSKVISDKYGRKPNVCFGMIMGSLLCISIAFIPSSGSIAVARVIFGVLGFCSISIAYTGIMVWSVELYPTSIRSKAIGLLSLMSRVGGGSAPWVSKGLKHFNAKLPFLAMGGSVLLAGLLLLKLPETRCILGGENKTEDVETADVIENTNVASIKR